MATANRVLKNTGFLYAKMGITVFISLYTTRLVLNALGVSDFGIYNLVGGAIAMLGFLHVAMSSATQRFMSYYEGKGDREKQKYIFNVSTVLHYGIALVLVLALLIAGYVFFTWFLNVPDDRIYAAKVIYGSLLVSTAFTVISVPYEAVLNAHENMFYYSVVGIFESVLKLTVALFVVYYSGDKLILYGILMAGVPFLSRTVMRIYCHKKYEECVIAPWKFWDGSLLKEMTSFAGWNFLGVASSMFSQYGQGLVLNYFFGTRLNAAQGIANQISGQLSVFSTTMLKALNPVIIKSEGSGDRDRMLRTSLVGSRISFFLLAIIVVPFIIEMPIILRLWLKNVPEYAIIFAQLLLFQKLIAQQFVNLTVSISASGEIREYQIANSILAALPLLVCFVLFNLGMSPVVMYIVFIIMVLIRSQITLYYAKKYCSLKYAVFFKSVVLPAAVVTLGGVLVALIPKLLLPDGLLRLGLVGVCYVISFLALMFFYGLASDERRMIFKMVNTLLSKIGLKKTV